MISEQELVGFSFVLANVYNLRIRDKDPAAESGEFRFVLRKAFEVQVDRWDEQFYFVGFYD